MLIYLYTFRIDKRFSDRGRVFGIEFFQIPVLSPILELGEKVFPGGRVWGVGFYPFSPGQLPNFQGKSPGIFPSITARVGTF